MSTTVTERWSLNLDSLRRRSVQVARFLRSRNEPKCGLRLRFFLSLLLN
nr:hypothetical protein [Nostoc sp. ChiSLP03a]